VSDFGKIGDLLLGKAPDPIKNVVEGAWPKFKYPRKFKLLYVKLKELKRFSPTQWQGSHSPWKRCVSSLVKQLTAAISKPHQCFCISSLALEVN